MEIKKNFHPIYRFYKTKGIVFFKSYILGLRNNLNPYIIFSFHPRKTFFIREVLLWSSSLNL